MSVEPSTNESGARSGPAHGGGSRAVPLSRGLSAKLILLTIIFVLLAEVLIFLPSIADYRMRWLRERLNTAAAVSVVLIEGDPASLSRTAQDDL
ncbi:hypothetical protein LWS74_13365, partial [Staphylococcus pasteuri]